MSEQEKNMPVNNDTGASPERKKRLIKLGALTAFAALVLVFSTIAWFAISKSVEAGSMAMTAADLNYEIITSDKEGLYDQYIDSGIVRWQLSAESNMNNLYTSEGDPDLKEITKFDSEQYGLKPGDYGSLKFTVRPRTEDTLSLSPIISAKGYKAQYDAENYMVDYDTGESLTELDDDTVKAFLSAHILFFYADDSGNKHLIPKEGFDVEVTGGEDKEVTVYWAWPATLEEILNADIDGLDASASQEVRRYFFESPGSFLKATGDEGFGNITVTKNDDTSAEEAEIAAKLPLLTGKDYSKYSAMYNDADQAIGDNVSFILAVLDA